MLRRIEIKGLYGHYDYDLPLISGPRKNICFLTGPNGYGKSTILDLICAFMKADDKTLLNIPYDTITFFLKDYKVVLTQERTEDTVDPNEDSSSSDDDVPVMVKLTTTVYTANGNQKLESVVFENKDLDIENATVFSPTLSVYLASIKVEYVRDDRLLPKNTDELGITSNVAMLQDEMLKFDEQLTALYNMKLLDNLRNNKPGDVEINEMDEADLLKRAEEKLAAYNRLGLATKLVDEDTSKDELYLKFMQMKAIDSLLSYDNELYEKLNLLYNIIEEAEFSDKKLVLDIRNGLYFISEDTIVIPEELSSGEQHFIVQVITLLIKAKSGSLVLIDEPELSYHPSWQMDYLKNLKRIAEIGQYQFILATHSPQIFDYKWGYTIDLYKQTTGNAERPEERN